MEPETGRVLAMASRPTFDPNRFQDSSQENFRNRCTAAAYEPGSTFKVFIVAAALELGVVQPADRFFCENGFYVLGGETISDTKAHGWLTVEKIISYSSNIGASKIGERLGKERMYRDIQAFGFGERSASDFPGESPGLLRPAQQWSQVAVGTVSFGQGIAVTPLQMVAALSAIANGGLLMRPYLVQSVIRPGGREEILEQPRKVRRVIKPETAALITKFMQKVVSPEGTAANAQVKGYPVAGKTGTAQKADEKNRGYAEGKYVSSFMGFLPANRPKLAMIVVIDEPAPENAWGGVVAAPIFQAIAAQAMVILKVPSEDQAPPIAEAPTLARPSPALKIRQWEADRQWQEDFKHKTAGRGIVVPDLHGLTMRQATKAMSGLPLQLELTGTGVVAEQLPPPGTVIREQTAVRLRLEVLP